MRNITKIGVCMMATALLCLMSTAAFAQNFNPADYTLSTTNNSNGFVTTNAPSGFYIQGSDGVCCGDQHTTYSTTLAAAETVSFDWNAHSNDAGGFYYDPFSISVNGVNLVYVTGIPYQTGYDASGSFTYNFNAGDTLAFDIYSTDGCCGPGTATISNYNETPEPGSLFLLGSGLVGLGGTLRRKLIA